MPMTDVSFRTCSELTLFGTNEEGIAKSIAACFFSYRIAAGKTCSVSSLLARRKLRYTLLSRCKSRDVIVIGRCLIRSGVFRKQHSERIPPRTSQSSDCMQINHRCLIEAQLMSTMREFSGDGVLPPIEALDRVSRGQLAIKCSAHHKFIQIRSKIHSLYSRRANGVPVAAYRLCGFEEKGQSDAG